MLGSSLRKIRLNNKSKRSGTATLTKAAVLAIAMAVAFWALPPAFIGVQANSCGDPFSFAFPMSAKQGDLATFFITIGNSTGADQSFVVQTQVFDPTNTVIAEIDKVASIPAGSFLNFQDGLITSTRNPPGTYIVITRTYQGTSLPICNTCFCSSTQTQFTLACNDNNC